MERFRAIRITLGFFIFTLCLIPLQVLFLRVSPCAARKLPQWYHNKVCKLLGLRFRVEGRLSSLSSLFLISNHISWLDIPLLSAIAPLSFVAKQEVGSWPFISILAKLQRTLFINRLRRSETKKKAKEIYSRLIQGDIIVLFGEGTSTDGNRVLPFKSSLFASVFPYTTSYDKKKLSQNSVSVQTVSIIYKSLNGVPLGRADRAHIGWFGDMDFMNHAWEVLKGGSLEAIVSIGPPVALPQFLNRKQLAEYAECAIRKEVVRLLRGYSPDKSFTVPKLLYGNKKPYIPGQISKKWQ